MFWLGACSTSAGEGRPPGTDASRDAGDEPAEAGPTIDADIVLPDAGEEAADATADNVPDAATDITPGDVLGDRPRDQVVPSDTITASCPSAAAFPSPDQPWVGPYTSELVQNLTALPERATVTTRRLAREQLATALQMLTLTPQTHSYGSGNNLHATLASTTGASQQVIVGAHFDTVAASPGANDNASGVAAVLAIARHLTQLPCRSRNVVFVLFDEEEVGLVGSRAFANKLAAEGAAVHSVHSIDQIGWDSNGDRLVELERADPGLRELYQAAVTRLGVTIPLSSVGTGSTDHVSFRPRFAAVGITEGYQGGDTTPHRHRATDRFPTINLDYLRSTTVLVMQVITDLVR